MENLSSQNVPTQEPIEKESNSALHFFLYLLAFLSLGFIAFGSGDIIFEFINKYFPDTLSESYLASFDQGSVKFGIAALFVSVPIFFYLMNLISNALYSGSMSEKSKIRRWLIYIVLFFAAGTIIGDLITLIIYFLDGDIVARFLLKVLTILIIAGAIFYYYFWDVRKIDAQNKIYKENKIAFFSSLALILIIFISGFFIIDSPSVTRDKKQDTQTVYDLQSVNRDIDDYYYSDANRLPQTLNELKSTKYESTIQMNSQMEYAKLSELSYKLCGVFKQSDMEDAKYKSVVDPNESWAHDAGKFCFVRNVVKPETVPAK
jgi:hypothetical protein